MHKPLSVLVVGCGRMGSAHAHAYNALDGFTLVGLVSKGGESSRTLSDQVGGVPTFKDFLQGMELTRPDAVSINTYPDTHAPYANQAMERGAHVFLEKPLAENLADAHNILLAARKFSRKLVVGYLLQHHPAYERFITVGKTLGKPLVMRIATNQQSSGSKWSIQRNLLQSVSPLVDCGVHYVDVMCRLTCAKPVRVHAMGTRLCEHLPPERGNYGQLQVFFEDGSVGWYETGWGPMISSAHPFVHDIIGPGGSVSMIRSSAGRQLVHHRSDIHPDGMFTHQDAATQLPDDPDRLELCTREQRFFLEAIRSDLDLQGHHRNALLSLEVTLAADESIRSKREVCLA